MQTMGPVRRGRGVDWPALVDEQDQPPPSHAACSSCIHLAKVRNIVVRFLASDLRRRALVDAL